jgi:hypothetical protein
VEEMDIMNGMGSTKGEGAFVGSERVDVEEERGVTCMM